MAPQPWMTARATRRVLAALAKGGAPARFVGGAVRDALLGRTVTDIDLATPAPPTRVLALLEAAGIRAIPTGLAHGTVTAVVSRRRFEITTLRVDVESLGRRARVAFTADWRADALRRDFTMNALSADPDGTLHDYVGGLRDLRARRVRFVGNPELRIREDVLRLLRFYRFLAQLGTRRPDTAARKACRALKSLLPTLSAERVTGELWKLLEADDPLPALRIMRRDGVLPLILPEARRFRRLQGLLAVEREIDPLLRLAALVEVDGEGARALARRLRLANAERDRLVALASPSWKLRLADDRHARRRALYHLGRERFCDVVLLRAAAVGDEGRRPARTLVAFAEKTRLPGFPLKGGDVVALGVAPGPRVKALLTEIATWWEAGDFRATRKACLAALARRIGSGDA